MHAYEEWGDACVDRLRGMFAFAIWDAPRRRLLLARDRLGIKPLYWTLAGDRLLFGSEIKADPRERPGSRRGERERRCPSCSSTRYLSGAETLFKGIHRLLPGHLLVFEDGAVAIERCTGTCRSRTRRRRDGRGSRTARLVDRFRELLEEAVRIAADGGRAARHVPLGRPRQQRDRRADGAA